jgi:hypothetical protein
MRSNRESARRSRRRKQAHMNELETQVMTYVFFLTLIHCSSFSSCILSLEDYVVSYRLVILGLNTLHC